MQGTFIGVLMSSTLPARLGEPSRALVVARRTGRPRENLPIVLGTVVSQTLLNIVALVVLGAVMFSSVDLFSGHQDALLVAAIAPLVLLIVVLLAPVVLAPHPTVRATRACISSRRRSAARWPACAPVWSCSASPGSAPPRRWRSCRLGRCSACPATSCWSRWGSISTPASAAAAAVLFAVNITAVLPATPANLGVFQAACAAVLHTGWHIGYGDGVAYGVILQAVEVTTAILMGMPALFKEGMSWREVRLRAMHTTPVKLPARPSSRQPTAPVQARS